MKLSLGLSRTLPRAYMHAFKAFTIARRFFKTDAWQKVASLLRQNISGQRKKTSVIGQVEHLPRRILECCVLSPINERISSRWQEWTREVRDRMGLKIQPTPNPLMAPHLSPTLTLSLIIFHPWPMAMVPRPHPSSPRKPFSITWKAASAQLSYQDWMVVDKVSLLWCLGRWRMVRECRNPVIFEAMGKQGEGLKGCGMGQGQVHTLYAHYVK